MKNLSLGLNVILTIAVVILYYFQFSNSSPAIPETTEGLEEIVAVPEEEIIEEKGGKPNIAYVNLDSLQLEYELYKELSKKSIAKEKRYTNEFNSKKNDFDKKYQQLVKDAPILTQSQGQIRQEALEQEQQKLLELEEQLSNKLRNEAIEMNNELATKIKDYVEKYNQELGYDIIIGSVQGSNIVLYNKESIDLTTPITEGLNREYNSEKEIKK